MRKVALSVLLLAVAFGFGSAAGAQSQWVPGNAYEIGPGDVLQVTVLGQPSFSGDFTVDRDGIIAYPFVGRVKASGLSTIELERKLVSLLGDGYLKRAQVSVVVKEYKSLRVFVTGEVKSPGPYGLKPDKSLLTLLGDIGDLTPNVGHEVVVIRPPGPTPPPPPPAVDENGNVIEPSPEPAPTPRPGPPLPGEEPGSTIFRVNLRELRSGYADRDLKLEVGDTVYFPKAAQVFVTGHVARPGAYPYEEGLTVYRLLAMAGSVTDRGSEKGTRLIRLVDGRKKESKVKLTDVVEPEDTLHVPERFF